MALGDCTLSFSQESKLLDDEYGTTMESFHHCAQVQVRTAKCLWKVRCQRTGVTASQCPPPTISTSAFLLLFPLLAGSKASEECREDTTRRKGCPFCALPLSAARPSGSPQQKLAAATWLCTAAQCF